MIPYRQTPNVSTWMVGSLIAATALNQPALLPARALAQATVRVWDIVNVQNGLI